MALSGTKKGTVTQNSAYYEYWLSWSAVQNTAGNYSDVTVTHYWKQIKARTFDTYSGRDYGITIDDGTGSKDCTKSGSKRMNYAPWPGNNVSISSHTKRVYHNDDGKKSITISTWANGHASNSNGSWGPSSTTADSGDCKASATIKLDDIPRKANLLSADNFDDEGNPTITYNNAAGNSVELLQACISLDGSRDDVPYRDVPKTGSFYPFDLTDEERKTLRKGTNSEVRYVTFYLKTKIAGVTYVSDLVRKFSIKDGKPVISANVYDNNQTTVNLTKNNKVLVKYYSNAHYEVTVTPKKEAIIPDNSVIVYHNGKTVIRTSGTWNSVENNTFKFDAVDSRGIPAETAEVVLEMVDYVKITCDLGNNKPSFNGNMTVTCSGNYFNGRFGSSGDQNTLTVEYRYKLQNGEYGEWKPMNVTPSGNTYTASANETGLQNSSTYVFQARAYDSLSGVNSLERSVKYTPVFDWGVDDMSINVPLDVKGAITSNGKPYYPVGASYFNDDPNKDPSVSFGGTWEKVRTFYGGELIAFACVTALGVHVVDPNIDTSFGADAMGTENAGTKYWYITNYIDDIIIKGNGAVKINTKGIVGMVEATCQITGLGGTNQTGIWFNGNNNALPSNVEMYPSNNNNTLMSGPIGTVYGGCSNNYIYKVLDDTNTTFSVNPRFRAYNGGMTINSGGTKSSLLVKVYAKPNVSYMWRKISN